MARNTLKLNAEGGKLVLSYEIAISAFPRSRRYYIRAIAVLPNGDLYRINVCEYFKTAKEAEKSFLSAVHEEREGYFTGGAA